MKDDLISREAAIDAVCEGADEWDETINLERNNYISDAISNIPSVEAVPVVHGKWMEYKYDEREYRSIIVPWDGEGIPYNIFCSECRMPALLNGHEEDVASKYCPHCGAKMDLEGKDENQ